MPKANGISGTGSGAAENEGSGAAKNEGSGAAENEGSGKEVAPPDPFAKKGAFVSRSHTSDMQLDQAVRSGAPVLQVMAERQDESRKNNEARRQLEAKMKGPNSLF